MRKGIRDFLKMDIFGGDYDLLFWIIQLSGALALLIQNCSQFLPCGKKILKVQIVSSLFWALHYGLMGLQNVMIMCFTAALRNFISCHVSYRTLMQYNVFHTISMCFFLIFAAAYISDFLPVLATIIVFFRFMCRDQLLWFHFFGVFSAGIWMCYYILNGAWFGVINDSIMMISCLTALILTWQRQRKMRLSTAVPA